MCINDADHLALLLLTLLALQHFVIKSKDGDGDSFERRERWTLAGYHAGQMCCVC